MAKLSIRIDLRNGSRLGPGKVALLERIDKFGSIAAAGRDLSMSYRRAWELTEEINAIFGKPVVVPKSGGTKGGGAALTPFGQKLLAHYRAVVTAAERASKSKLASLDRMAAPSSR